MPDLDLSPGQQQRWDTVCTRTHTHTATRWHHWAAKINRSMLTAFNYQDLSGLLLR